MNYEDNDYAPSHSAKYDADATAGDYLVKTVDKPVAVHVFNRQVVIVGNDGSVITLARR